MPRRSGKILGMFLSKARSVVQNLLFMFQVRQVLWVLNMVMIRFPYKADRMLVSFSRSTLFYVKLFEFK